jgi:hypothetical protein
MNCKDLQMVVTYFKVSKNFPVKKHTSLKNGAVSFVTIPVTSQ